MKILAVTIEKYNCREVMFKLLNYRRMVLYREGRMFNCTIPRIMCFYDTYVTNINTEQKRPWRMLWDFKLLPHLILNAVF